MKLPKYVRIQGREIAWKTKKPVAENGCICGRCREHSRVDFDKPHMQVTTFPGRGTDDDTDFSDWSIEVGHLLRRVLGVNPDNKNAAKTAV